MWITIDIMKSIMEVSQKIKNKPVMAVHTYNSSVLEG